MDFDALKTLLTENVVRVTHTKKDGSVATRTCTRHPDHLPPFVASGKKAPTLKDGDLPVYDLDAKGWRMISASSVSVAEIV